MTTLTMPNKAKKPEPPYRFEVELERRAADGGMTAAGEDALRAGAVVEELVLGQMSGRRLTDEQLRFAVSRLLQNGTSGNERMRVFAQNYDVVLLAALARTAKLSHQFMPTINDDQAQAVLDLETLATAIMNSEPQTSPSKARAKVLRMNPELLDAIGALLRPDAIKPL